MQFTQVSDRVTSDIWISGRKIKLIIKSSEKKEKSIVELVIEVSAEEFEAAINFSFRKNKNQISVPGFRKGKAPRKIIERMYGASVFHSDALDNIMPSVLSFVEEESKLNLVGFPQATDLDIKEEGGLDVTVSLSVYPEVKIGDYKGLSAYKPVPEVLDSEIDSEIAGIRLRNARIEKADRPAINGDTATIDYEGLIDGKPFEGGTGEDYDLELGSNTFIPGFEEKMHGMTVGEQRDLELVFPENYSEELAGKPVVFKVTIKELKEKILPDLDDEFAMDVSEFDTLEEYKAGIKDRILKIRQAEAEQAFENALMDKISQSLDAEVPEAMVAEQFDNAVNNFTQQISSYGMDPGMYLQMTNTTPEKFREDMEKASEKQVKIMLCLEKIAELEGIEISEEELENEYQDASERYGMEIDKLRESVATEVITRDIKLRRAAKVVTDSATALDTPPEDEAASEGEPTAAEEPAAESGPAAAEEPAAEGGPAAAEEPVAESGPAAADGPETEAAPLDTEAEAGAAKTEKTAAKKPAAKKTADAAKADAPDAAAEKTAKPAAKKPAAKKTAPKEQGAEATGGAATETGTAKKPAAKKSAAKKAEAD